MIHPIIYFPFILVEAMLGAALGCIVARRPHGLVEAAAIVFGMCNVAVIAFYLPQSLIRGSQWSIALIALGLATIIFGVWGIWESFRRESANAIRYRGLWWCGGLAVVFAVWCFLYTGSAIEARFWVINVTGKKMPDHVVFSVDGAAHRQFVVYREHEKWGNYVDSLDGATVPAVAFKIYQFGTPTYGSGNHHMAFIGDLPGVPSVDAVLNYDGAYLETLPWVTRSEAERLTGRKIESLLLQEYHADRR